MWRDGKLVGSSGEWVRFGSGCRAERRRGWEEDGEENAWYYGEQCVQEEEF